MAGKFFDSRGNPTVEVDVYLEDAAGAVQRYPPERQRASTKPLEMRDGDKARYLGKGVLNAVEHINNEIAEELDGADALDQAEIDHTLLALDGTPNKSKRERLLGVFNGCCPRCGRLPRHSPVPLPRRRTHHAAPRSHGQHHQRRKALRQQDRLSGIHGNAGLVPPPSVKASA